MARGADLSIVAIVPQRTITSVSLAESPDITDTPAMKPPRSFLLIACITAAPLACDTVKPEASKPDVAAKAPAKSAEAKPVEAKTEPKVEVEPVEPPTPPVVIPANVAALPPTVVPNADVVLDEMKDYYGLAVAEIDGWKPTWEPDTVGIQWAKPGHVDVTMVLNGTPIVKVEDIDRGFMAGTTLSKQDPPTKTAKGWYTIVTTKERETQGFVYVRQIGKSWLACDTLVSRGEGDDRPTVPAQTLVQICESADLP